MVEKFKETRVAAIRDNYKRKQFLSDRERLCYYENACTNIIINVTTSVCSCIDFFYKTI
jgi:hypothetical protein